MRSLKSSFSRRHFLMISIAACSTVILTNCQSATHVKSDAKSSTSRVTDNPKTLHIYTWADYSNENVYKQFEQKAGIKVVADVYDSNENMLAKMQAGGGKQYSIIYPSDYMVREMIKLKLLNNLDQTQVKGLENLSERWQNPPYDPSNAHSIPVSWGTTGLIYNTDVISNAPNDWQYLWDNQEKLKGKMTLLDDVREVMGATLKSLGYSYNSTSSAELAQAFNKLKELRPALASFQTFGWEDQLIAGDLALCMTFSILGNALTRDNKNLSYIIPKSGTSVWTDTMVIPVGAPNLNAAYEWINFMLDPENASDAVKLMNFATPNKKAFELLPTELKENTNLFPTKDMMKTFEGIVPVDEIETYDRYWTELKSG